jgi:predicted nucleotidyltransferase
MVDGEVLKVVRGYLAAVRRAGIGAERAIVFGSHARGEATADSDIDVIVIAPDFDGPRDRARTALLWRLRASTDSRIEPVGVGVRQWSEDEGNPLIAVARLEGEEVASN